MNPPDFVQWVNRSGQDYDCAIAAIMLACGPSYNAVLAEAIRIQPDAVKRGMNWRDIKATVHRLGWQYRMRRKYDLTTDTGILGVTGFQGDHVVYLWAGRVIEPRPDAPGHWLYARKFLDSQGWTAGMLLTVKKD